MTYTKDGPAAAGKKKAIFIAEKPDQMRTIAKVYQDHRSKIPYTIEFFAQRGHLLRVPYPEEFDEGLKRWSWDTIPFHPEDHGGWKYKLPDEKKTGKFKTPKERYAEIKKAIVSGGYDFIIHGGDPDQEGELLVWETIEQTRTKLPVKRFWLNDLNEEDVLEALLNLRDESEDDFLQNLHKAATARQRADYRFGMNGTRAVTLKTGSTMPIGRVKTPILNIIVKREQAIRDFVPSSVYGVQLDYTEGTAGVLYEPPKGKAGKDKEDTGIVWFDTREEAEEKSKSIKGDAVVSSCTRTKTETPPPKLFKLATLQIAAGKYGYKDDDTLRILQGLYEKKLLSYPRTSCEVLGTKDNIKAFLASARAVPDIKPFLEDVTDDDIKRVRGTKRWFDDAKVASEGHTALRPTAKKPDFESLSKEEQDIYRLVARQFAAAFLPPLVEEKAVMLAKVGEDTFRTAGKVCLDPGFTKIFDKKITDTPIPEHKKGDILPVSGHTITEKAASCPKHITSPDMIAICENPAKYLDDVALKKLGKRLKIGTPATRSSIIRQLIDRDHYLIEKKEGKKAYLSPTEKGEFLIRTIGDMTICKVDMTGQWEEQLEDIRTGKLGLEEFEESIIEDVNKLVDDIHNLETERFDEGTAKGKTAAKGASKDGTRKEYGTCPTCGGTLLKNRYGWYCSNYKDGCHVSVYENVFKDSGIKINDDEFKKLMEGESITIRPISKKTKEPYERSVHYDFKEDKIVFEEFGKKADRKWVSDNCCPFCGENLEENDLKLWCGCGTVIYKQVFGVSLTDEEIRQLCVDRKTSSFRGRKGKNGKSYTGRFRFNTDKQVTIQFPKKS